MRRFCLAIVATFGLVSAASAQAPILTPATAPAPAALASQPTGLVPAPVAAPAAQPMYVVTPSTGSATSSVPCATGDCGPTVQKSHLSRKFIGCGTASPASCGTFASERTFLFGSCNAFFTPCKTCGGSAIEYGSGGMGPKDGCKHITSYTNR